MNECFSSINHINIIVRFIQYKDILNLSFVNKSFYFILNPENNSNINSIFRDITFRKYCGINNKIFYKSNHDNSLDDFKITKNNWKNILKKIYLNSKIYQNKDISEEIYRCFNIHCYFPYQRNENPILEYENSTLHQKFCYDIYKNDSIVQNHYDKYFDAKKENYKKVKIEPLKKGLFFEQDLINLKSEIKDFENKKIINMILNYSFEKLNKVQYSNIINNKKIKKKKKCNSITYFLIWLNHTFILFINLMYKYIYQYSNCKDEKIIIGEYSKAHSNLINFGLMIDENFNNINIIFNYANKGKTGVNSQFRIYKMFMIIMEQKFYNKLKPILNKNIEKVMNHFYNEIFDKERNNNSFDSINRATNNSSEPINEENENDDYLNESSNLVIDIDDDDDDNDNFDFEENSSYEEIFEKYTNLILDFSITRDNANFINHSKIKLNKCYNEYENLILENILNNIKNNFKVEDDNQINQTKNNNLNEQISSLKLFFSFIKKISQKEEKVEEEKEKIKLINRTKYKLLKKCENYIFNYLNEVIKTNFNYYINNLNIKEKNTNLSKDLFFNNYINIKNNGNDLYYNRLDEIKKNLIKKYKDINYKTKKELEELINNYIDSNSDVIIRISKEILLLFNSQNFIYERQDQMIIDTLFKKQKNTKFQSFENYLDN